LLVIAAHQDEGGRISLVLRPDLALSARQAGYVVTAVSLVVLGIGGTFAALGLYLILPFSGLVILGIAAGFYACFHAGARCEAIIVSAEEVVVEKGRQHRPPTERVGFPRPWVRVEIESSADPWNPPRLSLIARDRTVEVGAFLRAEERQALAAQLRTALAYPPDAAPGTTTQAGDKGDGQGTGDG
jgi:uncharacterized membrane protein